MSEYLNPERLKRQLMAGGIYLAAYEMFKTSLVEYPKKFYSTYGENGDQIVTDDYKNEVIALNPKYIFNASAQWWKKQQVFSDADIVLAQTIREHRDAIAHDIPRFLGSNDGHIRIDLINSIYALLTKVDQWWIREIEIPSNDEFDDKIFTEAELAANMSGRMVFLSLIAPIAFGDESSLRYVYEAIQKKKMG